MHAIVIATAVGTIWADPPSLRLDITRAVARFQTMLKEHEKSQQQQLIQSAKGARAMLRQIDNRIAELQKEADSERKTTRLADLKFVRSHYEYLSQFEPLDRR